MKDIFKSQTNGTAALPPQGKRSEKDPPQPETNAGRDVEKEFRDAAAAPPFTHGPSGPLDAFQYMAHGPSGPFVNSALTISPSGPLAAVKPMERGPSGPFELPGMYRPLFVGISATQVESGAARLASAPTMRQRETKEFSPEPARLLSAPKYHFFIISPEGSALCFIWQLKNGANSSRDGWSVLTSSNDKKLRKALDAFNSSIGSYGNFQATAVRHVGDCDFHGKRREIYAVGAPQKFVLRENPGIFQYKWLPMDTLLRTGDPAVRFAIKKLGAEKIRQAAQQAPLVIPTDAPDEENALAFNAS